MSQDAKLHFLTYWHELANNINKLKNETKRITEGRFQANGPGNAKGQLFKIVEEVVETRKELRKNNAVKEIEEDLDILFAWLSFNHIQQYSDEEILWGVQRSLDKFMKRGWIEFK